MELSNLFAMPSYTTSQPIHEKTRSPTSEEYGASQTIPIEKEASRSRKIAAVIETNYRVHVQYIQEQLLVKHTQELQFLEIKYKI